MTYWLWNATNGTGIRVTVPGSEVCLFHPNSIDDPAGSDPQS
jgi:hypothetical protein